MKKRQLVLISLALATALSFTGCSRFTFFNELINGAQDASGSSSRESQWKKENEEKKSSYEAYERPEAFNGKALEGILALTPIKEFTRTDDYDGAKDALEQSENPYVVSIADPDFYETTAQDMLDRYFGYDMCMAGGFPLSEDKDKYNYIEVVSTNVIAGDINDFAVEVLANINVPEVSNSIYAQYGKAGEDGSIHCSFTVHGKKVSDYGFELVGLTYSKDVRGKMAISSEYVSEDPVPYSDTGYKIENDTLYITYDGKENYSAVPLSMDKLFDRGDGNGASESSTLESGSYFISENKTAFIYGGGSLPVSIMLSDDKGGNWQEVTISSRQGIRRSFVGFVGENFAYALTCGDRTMGAEWSELSISYDGGYKWESLGSPMPNGTFLVTGCCFISEKVGFISVTSSQWPDIYRTEDGGRTWQEITLNVEPEYYTMAYAPTATEEGLVMYIGEEGYGENAGQMLKVISTDGGKSWQRAGLVVR